jgi:hypothetical protein
LRITAFAVRPTWQGKPYAKCGTEGCFAARGPVVNLDSAESVKAWNTRDVAQAAPEPLDYGDELLRWSNIEVALRKKFPTLNATGIEIDNWPALIDALAMSSTDREGK